MAVSKRSGGAITAVRAVEGPAPTATSSLSFVDLPGGMPKEVFRSLQKVRVGGQQLQISLALKTQAERLKREHVPARKPFEKKGPHKAHKAHKPRK